jgi:hypothetical protein
MKHYETNASSAELACPRLRDHPTRQIEAQQIVFPEVLSLPLTAVYYFAIQFSNLSSTVAVDFLHFEHIYQIRTDKIKVILKWNMFTINEKYL